MGWMREGLVFTANRLGTLLMAVRRDVATAGTGIDDGEVAALSVDSTGKLWVNAGTVTASSSGAAAHDAAVSGNPVSMGAVASAAAPTSVSADQDAVRLWALRNGAMAVQPTAAGALIGGDATNGMDVDVTRVAVPTTFYMGQTTVTTSGTEVTLGASQALTQGVWVKALAANTGFIYVGTNPVTTSTGYQLDNNESVFIPIANLTTVYIDASVNNEGVSYLGF